MTTRGERLSAANELLSVIAGTGRRFFNGRNRIAYFDVDARGRVWFVDEYNGARVYTHYAGPWRRFTSGGTLRRLVVSLRDYIAKGHLVNSYHFGPWPDWICAGDLWGYGDDMERVREAAARLGVVEPPAARAGERKGGEDDHDL